MGTSQTSRAYWHSFSRTHTLRACFVVFPQGSNFQPAITDYFRDAENAFVSVFQNGQVQSFLTEQKAAFDARTRQVINTFGGGNYDFDGLLQAGLQYANGAVQAGVDYLVKRGN